MIDARALHKRTIEGQAEIGRRLIAFRDRIERGHFLKWIEAEFSKSTAYCLINMAENLAAELPTVGSLPPTVIYQLAAPTTPLAARADIINRLKAGEQIPPEAIVEGVREAREADRKAKAEAKLTAEARKKRHQKEKRQRRSAAQREAEYEQRQQERAQEEQSDARAVAEAVVLLRKHIPEEEIDHLAELFDRRASWVVDVLKGKLPSYLSRHASSILEPLLLPTSTEEGALARSGGGLVPLQKRAVS